MTPTSCCCSPSGAEFGELDPRELGAVTAARVIVDGRYMLDPAAWRAAGWVYRASGIPADAADVADVSDVARQPRPTWPGGAADRAVIQP